MNKKLTSLLVISLINTAIAVDQNPVKLDSVEVTGTSGKVKNQIKKELSNISGGSSLFDLNDTPTTKSTLNDILGNETGIIMQPFFGANDQPRISIRGSGIQDNPVDRGIQLLYDGLPVNQADGSFIIGLVAPEQMRFVTVYRGANAQEYGSTTLGGAINFIARTGQTSENFVRLQVGSFNTVEGSFGIGDIRDNFDFFITGGASDTENFRNFSDSKRTNFAANMGFQINENTTNRTWFNYTDSFFQIPFVTQKDIAILHPEAVIGDGFATNFPPPGTLPPPAIGHPAFGWNIRGGWDGLFDVYKRKPHRDTQQLRIANKTTIYSGNTTHKFGIYVDSVDDEFTDPLTHTVVDSNNIGVNYTMLKETTVGNDILFTVNYNKGSMPTEYWVNSAVDGSKVFKFGDLDLDASNAVIGLQYTRNLSEVTQLNIGLQYLYSDRDITGPASTPPSQGLDTAIVNHDRSFSFDAFNPKLGLSFQVNDELRIFTNISASVETPTFNHLVTRAATPFILPGLTLSPPQVPPFAVAEIASGLTVLDLGEQTSTTFEIGAQHQGDNKSWEASYYYTKIDDELITLIDGFAVNSATLNYPDNTTHQGIELGFNAKFAEQSMGENSYFTTKFVYNYSHFTFDGGVFNGNQIAGIPEHLGYIDLTYHMGNKFSIGPNIRFQPSDTYVDHANTQVQDSYTLIGLKALYQPNYNLKFFLDAQNLADETYQTSYVIRGISAVNQPTFLAGFGTSVKAGVEYSW